MGKFLNNPVELLAENSKNDSVLVQCTDNGDLIVASTTEVSVSDGELYNTGYYWDENNQIPNDGNADILLQVNEQLHLSGSVVADGDTEVEFWENVTFSNAGTSLGILNKNRNKPNNISSLFSYAPTITDFGTRIVRVFSPGGTKEKTFGSAVTGGDGDFILKPAQNYLLRAVNKSNSNERVQIGLVMIPHIPL